MEEIKVPRRISQALLNSINAGVTPRIGLEYMLVGRRKEISSVLFDLENIKEAGASFKFVIGRYGSGKSFLLQLIRNLSLDRNYVTADCDLSPTIRLAGTKGQGLSVYKALVSNLSTKVRPDGNALGAIIDKWLSNVYSLVLTEKGYQIEHAMFEKEVHSKIHSIINNMESMVNGFEFANVLTIYERANRLSDDETKGNCIRFLRGEISTKTEAKKILNVTSVINDENWYEYIKIIAAFTAQLGYSGLIIIIDEGVNLYKISNAVSRQNNYEMILNMFNDATQGKIKHLGFYFGGTPQLLEDSRRGFYSYEALRTRLAENAFAGHDYTDFYSPVIRLSQLENEDLFVLIKKITMIHSAHFNYVSSITDENILGFMQAYSSKVGADKMLTPREIIRDYASILNIMIQNESLSFGDLVKTTNFTGAKDTDSVESDEFEEFDV